MANSRKISILGSGWLGLPLTEHLSSKGYQAKTSTRSVLRADQIREQGIDVAVFDIEDIDKSELAFLDVDIFIINITSKNIGAFENLITEIEKSPIKKVLFVSSTSVYPNLNKVITEDHANELQDSKLFQIENLFRKNNNFKTTILRLSGLIGYSRHPGEWFSTRPISQPDAPVNLIHRDDCIGLIEAIIKQQAWDEIFNGCTDTHPIKRNYYLYARSLLNHPAPESKEGEILKYKIISNKKSKTILNYKYKYANLMNIVFES